MWTFRDLFILKSTILTFHCCQILMHKRITDGRQNREKILI